MVRLNFQRVEGTRGSAAKINIKLDLNLVQTKEIRNTSTHLSGAEALPKKLIFIFAKSRWVIE